MTDPRPFAELVRSQILALKSKHPELADDADLLAGMIEGETDFERVIDRLAQGVIEARAYSKGLAETIGTFKTRQQRFEKKERALLDMALALLSAAEQSKVVTPSATLWTRGGGTSVVVDDVEQLPQGYFRNERIADKTAIKKSIEAGEPVPGARLETSGPSISIRTN